MADRLKHPRKDLDHVLRSALDQGWRIVRGKAYFKMYCPCDSKHKKTVHISPSDPKYRRNLLAWLRRETCWKGQP